MKVESAYIHLKSIVSKLSQLSTDEWNDFESKWEEVVISKNDFIIKAGQVERYFYFVHDGMLRAFVLNDGADISVGFSYNGDFSGAYDSFLEQSVTDWNIQALDRFDRLFKQSPHIFQLVSQKHLASYLGMTPETLSRLRRLKMNN